MRERLGDPRDLPYFCGCAFRACCRPCSGGPPRLPIVLTRRFQASSNYHGVATHKTVSASNIRRVIRFRSCIVLVMLRPARLPSPPDWLRRDEATCTSPRPLRYIVTPAFDAARYRATLGVRLDGRTGNLPSSGLSPDKSQQLVRLHDNRNKLHFVPRGRESLPGDRSFQLLIREPYVYFGRSAGRDSPAESRLQGGFLRKTLLQNKQAHTAILT